MSLTSSKLCVLVEIALKMSMVYSTASFLSYYFNVFYVKKKNCTLIPQNFKSFKEELHIKNLLSRHSYMLALACLCFRIFVMIYSHSIHFNRHLLGDRKYPTLRHSNKNNLVFAFQSPKAQKKNINKNK